MLCPNIKLFSRAVPGYEWERWPSLKTEPDHSIFPQTSCPLRASREISADQNSKLSEPWDMKFQKTTMFLFLKDFLQSLLISYTGECCSSSSKPFTSFRSNLYGKHHSIFSNSQIASDLLSIGYQRDQFFSDIFTTFMLGFRGLETSLCLSINPQQTKIEVAWSPKIECCKKHSCREYEEENREKDKMGAHTQFKEFAPVNEGHYISPRLQLGIH